MGRALAGSLYPFVAPVRVPPQSVYVGLGGAGLFDCGSSSSTVALLPEIRAGTWQTVPWGVNRCPMFDLGRSWMDSWRDRVVASPCILITLRWKSPAPSILIRVERGITHAR